MSCATGFWLKSGAVHESFQRLFTIPGGGNTLSFKGTYVDGRWGAGCLESADGLSSVPVRSGIPRFVESADDPWTPDAVQQIRDQYGIDPGKLIELDVTKILHHWPDRQLYDVWIKEIAKVKGPIVEIACGPGGGMAPLILDANPEATILMTDVGGWILEQWQSYVTRRGDWLNVSFAQFDATSVPLRSESVAMVTSLGGLSNVADQAATLLEIRRMLEPGGRLCIIEALPDRESFELLPTDVKSRFSGEYQAITKGFDRLLTDAGFEITDMTQTTARQLSPAESSLAKAASQYGVKLSLGFFRITALPI